VPGICGSPPEWKAGFAGASLTMKPQRMVGYGGCIMVHISYLCIIYIYINIVYHTLLARWLESTTFEPTRNSDWDHETSHEGKLSIAGLHVKSLLRLPLKGSQGLAGRSLCKFNQFSAYRMYKCFGWISSKQNYQNSPQSLYQKYVELSHDPQVYEPMIPSVNSCPLQPNKLAIELSQPCQIRM